MMQEVIPLWRKFNAKSPHYSDFGKAMYDAYFHYGYDDAHPKGFYDQRHLFTEDDLHTLIDFMWHEERAYEAVQHDMRVQLHEILIFCTENFSECIKKLKVIPSWLKNPMRFKDK